MNAQENYDQLKRRNRRRLVGALIMVIVAVVLLVMMFNHHSSKQIEPPQLDVVTNKPIQAETGRTTDPISDVVIQEPVSNTPTNVPVQNTASIPIAGIQATTQASVPQTQIDPHQSEIGNHRAGTQTGHVTENKIKQPQTTVQATGSHPKTDSGSHQTPVNKENVKTPSAGKTPVIVKDKEGTGGKKTVTKGTSAVVKKNTQPKQLTPQQILENKAANQVSVPTQAKKQASTTATVNTPIERTVIQVGAYTTEAQAKLVQQKLAAIGINSSINSGQTSKGTLYRVRSGIYNSRALALQNLNKIQAAGLNGMVIGL